MPSVRQKFSVGLFVIVGLIVTLFFMLLLGITDYFYDGHRCAAYFDDSVRGLNNGAEVTYRGVGIGRVETINVAPDGVQVEIIMRIDTQITDISKLEATVASLGITGIMNIELERPDKPPEAPELTFEPAYPVIATRRSEMSRIIEGATEFAETFQEMRIKEIFHQFENTLDNINRVLVNAQIEEISAGLRTTIEKTNTILNLEQWEEMRISLLSTTENFNRLVHDSHKTVSQVESFLEMNTDSIEQTIAEAEKATEFASKFFREANIIIRDTDSRIERYDQRLAIIVDDLQQAAASLNRLLDQLSNHPSQIIFGRPAPAKPIEE